MMFSTAARAALVAVLPLVAGDVVSTDREQQNQPLPSFRNEYAIMEGHTVKESYSKPLPYTYIEQDDLPDNFYWGNVNGKSYLTHSLNQHIPQYCGSCWCHGALSSLGDRIKITNSSKDEINLSVQYVLNCGGSVAGSCHGGSASGVFEFIKSHSGHVPYDTCSPYMACSSESKEGICPYVDTSCTTVNTCKTCDTFAGMGGECTAIDYYPNATIAEYGAYSILSAPTSIVHKLQAEIYARGPVATGVNAEPLVKYTGGIVRNFKPWNMLVNHIVSIVGWGTDPQTSEVFWIVRNSWGEYWGEMGFFRIVAGHNSLGIEEDVSWATPGTFTVENTPCFEDGGNCHKAHRYIDPSEQQHVIAERLAREPPKKFNRKSSVVADSVGGLRVAA